MSLAPGRTLGVYEIVEPLGAGGMGEVYRAHDTKLNRDVAIKVLPPAFAQDRERLVRFEREAQALAALNHRHIAQIYGVLDAPPALVMEFADGEDLSARVARGPIPMEEALPLAVQIAEALECAHERGIIHRDLKPANIKVTSDGVVKVLDFGLAKALAPELAANAPGAFQNSPTFTSPATQLGVILGTAAYMAPEQARGKPADRRADVWAFGGVLFEMLTGRRAFAGDDVTDVIASIMRGEPEWSALPPETPPGIRKLLHRCLEKDRARRLDSMAVARFEIQDALAAPHLAATPSAAPAGRPGAWAMLATVVLVAAAASTVTWWAVGPGDMNAPLLRVHVTPAPPDALSLDTFGPDVDISPDGNVIAYAGKRAGMPPEIFIRRLDQDHGVPLPGTTDGRSPIFSADGQWVTFQATTEIKKVSVQGGTPQLICAGCAGGFRGGTWLPDGSFVYSTAGGQRGLFVLRPGATSVELLTRVDQEATSRRHVYPRALPGGHAILFGIESVDENSDVAVFDLRSKAVKVLVRGGVAAQYAPSGHLLYAAAGTLYAVPFDAQRLETTGAAAPVLQGVVTKSAGGASYAVAPNGTLVYVAGDPIASSYSIAISRRNGTQEPLPLSRGAYILGRFSPNGQQAIFDSRAYGMDLWVWNFAQQKQRRLTFAPTADQYPVWTPNGRHIIYAGAEGGVQSLYRRDADGTGSPERLTSHDAVLYPTAITPDGETLLAHAPVGTAAFPRGIYTISMSGDHTPRRLAGTAANPLNASLSFDGKWIAYQTSEAEQAPEVVVHPFPNLAGGRWQVSTSGGAQPLFSKRGDELFYRDPQRRLLSVKVSFTPQFSHGNPAVLLENVYAPGPGRPYDVSPDGERIILVNESRLEQSSGRPPQLNLIFNWSAELKRLAPDGNR